MAITKHSGRIVKTISIGISLLVAGCVFHALEDTNDIHVQTEPDEVEAQRIEINKLLVANHPHFTEGKPRSPSLNVDAFDFMLGQSVQKFPTLFGDHWKFVELQVESSSQMDERIKAWIANRNLRNTAGKTYLKFHSAIGRTFGYNAQEDFLVFEVTNQEITAWELFPITLY